MDTAALRLDNATHPTWTIAGWVYPTAFSSYSTIYSYGLFRASLGFYGSTGRLETWFNNASAFRGNAVLPLNAWSYVALVNDGVNRTFYVNGQLDLAAAAPAITTSNTDNGIGVQINGGSPMANTALPGQIDDIAVWGVNLSASEIQAIYSRQSAKYAGQFTSRVMDYGSSRTWSGLKWLTTLPFGKELTGDADNSGTITSADSETHADYPSLVGSTGSTSDDNLMSGIKALWHMNGTLGTIADDASITDSAGTHTGAAKDADATNTIAYTNGLLSQGIYLDGTNDYVSVPDSTDWNFGSSDFTISLWFNPSTKPGGGAGSRLFGQANGGVFTPILFLYESGRVYIYVSSTGSSWVGAVLATVDEPKLSSWNHIVVTRSGSSWSLWQDGKQNGATYSHTGAYTLYDSAQPLVIGGNFAPYYKGVIDEVAVWNRALNTNEIKQLYRRGANRIKFQTKACIDVNCNCKSYGASGSTTDCDGDGTLNAADTSDVNKAIWLGSDNTNGTYFSELHNKDLYDSIANCGASNLVLTLSPDLQFSCFSSPLASALTNQYFQYRTILESDDTSTNCSYGSGATWCSPELKSVEIKP